MKYYLAYGSNLNKDQMAYRCPGAIPVGTMMLEGYELLFKGNALGVLTIEKKKGGKVPLGIWKVDAEHEKALDRYEGFPTLYYKKEIPIPGGKTGFIYIMHEDRKLCYKSQRYYDICAKGYEDFGFDVKYSNEALKRSMEEFE